jgi:hypothetical protein
MPVRAQRLFQLFAFQLGAFIGFAVHPTRFLWEWQGNCRGATDAGPNSGGAGGMLASSRLDVAIRRSCEAVAAAHDVAGVIEFRNPLLALANKPGAPATEFAAGPLNSEFVISAAPGVLELHP